jgi:ABC-type multidrug transport system permease subunit
MLSATVLLYYYGLPIQIRRDLCKFVGITILVSWSFLMLGFVVGLILAKLRFV